MLLFGSRKESVYAKSDYSVELYYFSAKYGSMHRQPGSHRTSPPVTRLMVWLASCVFCTALSVIPNRSFFESGTQPGTQRRYTVHGAYLGTRGLTFAVLLPFYCN